MNYLSIFRFRLPLVENILKSLKLPKLNTKYEQADLSVILCSNRSTVFLVNKFKNFNPSVLDYLYKMFKFNEKLNSRLYSF